MAIKKATPDNSKYNQKDIVPNGSGNKAIETARKKFAKHGDKPTMAAAKPGMKIPEALMQVDPNMISQVLPNMFKQFMQIRNLMTAFNTQNSNVSAPGSSSKNITDVFSGALAILVKKFGFEYVLTLLFKILGENKYLTILPDYKDIVFNSIIKLMKLAAENGETNIPVSTVPEIVFGIKIPSPLTTLVVDGYIQQYYTLELDPYPGYIQWLTPSGTLVYTKRTKDDPPFESADEEIRTTSEINLANELIPYFMDKNLTIPILNVLLVKYSVSIQEKQIDKNMGKNSNKNLLAILTQLAGIAGQMAQGAQQNHLPKSVLNQSSVSKSLDTHKQNIGKIKKLKEFSKTAVIPQIPGLGDISNLMSSDLSSKVTSGMAIYNKVKSKF
jgi:hypothetical protein